MLWSFSLTRGLRIEAALVVDAPTLGEDEEEQEDERSAVLAAAAAEWPSEKWAVAFEGEERVRVTSGALPLGEGVPHADAPLVGLAFSTDLKRSILTEAALLRPSAVRRALRKAAPGLKALTLHPDVFEVALKMRARLEQNDVALKVTHRPCPHNPNTSPQPLQR